MKIFDRWVLQRNHVLCHKDTVPERLPLRAVKVAMSRWFHAARVGGESQLAKRATAIPAVIKKKL